MDFEGEEKEAIPGTFEDCLIYTNYDLFKKIKVTDSGNLVEQTHDLLNSNDTFEMIHEKIYKMLRAGKSEQKAEFALDVIFEISPDELSVPPYINQGLMWLQDYLHPEDSITRTTRLFYVACTRAQKSLAIIAYTYDCEAVKATAMKNNWFEDDEIRLLE